MTSQLKKAFKSAFDKFMTEDFKSAVKSSTIASWAGSGYSVELFPDGRYRLLWNNDIGNLYQPPGIILPIPVLNDDEWDFENSYFGNVEEILKEDFDEIISSIENPEGCEE